MIRVLTILLFLSVSFISFAKDITKQEATDYAKKFLREKNFESFSNIKSVEPVEKNNIILYYIVNFNPQGWVLITADDSANPVIGYSFEGKYVSEDLPYNMNCWMEIYINELQEIKRSKNRIKNKLWDSPDIDTKASDIIDPLIKVNWNQGKPYNQFLPLALGTNKRPYVGCVAVALAQALSVAKYPEKGAGLVSYTPSNPQFPTLSLNFDTIPKYDWNVIISGSDGKVAVARLLYHCGMIVKMNYGTEGSGAFASDIPSALRKYFGYSSSVAYYERGSYKENWSDLILSELKAGRPVIYSGYPPENTSGHCFNIDGYNGSFYHVNWGWGGSNNGYFSIDGLKDGDQDYTRNQNVIVGVRAPIQGPTGISLSNLTIGAGKEIGTVVGEVTVESEIKSDGYVFELKGPKNLFTGKYLPSSYEIDELSLKTLKVFSYNEDYPEDNVEPVFIKAIDKKNNLNFEKEFIIKIVKATAIDGKEAEKWDVLVLNNKSILIKALKNSKYKIYSISGRLVKTGFLELGENNIPIDAVSQGCFIISIETNKLEGAYKFVIK
ncbi:MAG: thiol protease/hemagglutinin PrtT [Bacteroidales bacterium]|nr:thiol protease/hemagglutinin PrtT [Bacteroidales bacterium]